MTDTDQTATIATTVITPLNDGVEAYTTYDPAELEGFFQTADGQRVTSVGDDGDVLIVGHVDDDTAWRLFCAWKVDYDGEAPSEEGRQLYDIWRALASFANHCSSCEKLGCSHEEAELCGACRAGDHDVCDDRACLCGQDYDHDRPAEWPCSCECYCDEYAWWVEEAKTNGQPVTWVRFSEAKARRAAEQAAASAETGREEGGRG